MISQIGFYVVVLISEWTQFDKMVFFDWLKTIKKDVGILTVSTEKMAKCEENIAILLEKLLKKLEND